MKFYLNFVWKKAKKASNNRDYNRARNFALYSLQLRPAEIKGRTQMELCELYLDLEQRENLGLTDRLALAQKIYARDPDFGTIQDDLATTYMELGDEAVLNHEEEDALSWYKMICALKPNEARLVSLAANKMRSLEDTITRRNLKKTKNQKVAPSLEAAANPPLEGQKAPSDQPDFQNLETQPETDGVNRLRERVSRAQKAWDAGRKEVGSEYIYLVEQYTQSIRPNPWQPIFPRVCYDYGKWLIDQRQYGEARPYFQKAQALGMPAASQRISEIDRLLRDQFYGLRKPSSPDLPDNSLPIRLAMAKVPPADEPLQISDFEPSIDRSRTSLLTGRPPLIQRRVELPEDGTFVGTSHAGDGVLTTNPVEETPPGLKPKPLSAAAMAAGNGPEVFFENTTPTIQGSKGEEPKSREAASPGRENRRNSPGSSDLLHGAAQREVSRLRTHGMPSPLSPEEFARRQRKERFLGLLSTVTPVLVISLVIIGIVALAFFGLNTLRRVPEVIPEITPVISTVQAGSIPTVATTSTTGISPRPTLITGTPITGVPSNPTSLIARMEGVLPSEIRVFLAAQNEIPLGYREREFVQEGGVFRLPQPLVEKLDFSLKYILVARPKDTPTRKYLADLALDNPLQTLWAKGEIIIQAGSPLEVSLKISSEAANFYPLDGGDQESDLPGGGHYYKATRHNVRGEFFKFYIDNGSLNRLGFPISEEFELKDQGIVQFFERGWLVRNSTDKLVRIGNLGKTILEDPLIDSSLKAPPSVGTAAFRVDSAFATANENNRYGKPLSPAFEVSSGNTKKRVQYFELARLELDASNKINLGLLGTEYARAKSWLR